MSALAPLVCLQAVQDWLNTGDQGAQYPSNSNALLTRLIAAASTFVPTYLARPVSPTAFSESYNGNGRASLALRQTPIVSVSSVTVDATAIPARPAVGQYGYVADARALYIVGSHYGFGSQAGHFRNGIQNIQVDYVAGYQTSESLNVPPVGGDGSGPLINTYGTLSRTWNADMGVSYATGVALQAVTVAPSAGQYQITQDDNGTPQYLFAAPDAGASIVVTYGFTPDDVAQATIELVGERYMARTRIGVASQNFGQQSLTTSFSQRDMNPTIKAMLQPYRNVFQTA